MDIFEAVCEFDPDGSETITLKANSVTEAKSTCITLLKSKYPNGTNFKVKAIMLIKDK